MSKPGETVQEWEQRVRASANGPVRAYCWCPWCKVRARGFRRDGKFMAVCSRCGKTWTRHKR